MSGVENNFRSFTLRFPRLQREVKCGFGICMDINWKDFEQARILRDEAVLADHQIAHDNQLLIFVAAWCDPTPNKEVADESDEMSETFNYWASRLVKVARSKTMSNRPFHFICSNRVGVEKSIMFVGTSCAIQLRPKIAMASEALGMKE